MNRLFVYGTLMDESVQKKVIGRVVEFENDTLSGYFKSKVVINNNTYPILVKGQGEIAGRVLLIDEKELEKIDEYETKAYRRIEKELKSGNNAWVYVK